MGYCELECKGWQAAGYHFLQKLVSRVASLMINPRFILIVDFLQNWNWMSKAESIIFSSLTPLVTTFCVIMSMTFHQ